MPRTTENSRCIMLVLALLEPALQTGQAMTVAISTLIKDASAQTLGALGGILKKGADHAAAHKLPEEVFLNFRLFPDMFPLSRQVQIATDTMTRGAARLA